MLIANAYRIHNWLAMVYVSCRVKRRIRSENEISGELIWKATEPKHRTNKRCVIEMVQATKRERERERTVRQTDRQKERVIRRDRMRQAVSVSSSYSVRCFYQTYTVDQLWFSPRIAIVDSYVPRHLTRRVGYFPTTECIRFLKKKKTKIIFVENSALTGDKQGEHFPVYPVQRSDVQMVHWSVSFCWTELWLESFIYNFFIYTPVEKIMIHIRLLTF